MTVRTACLITGLLALAPPLAAQTTTDPTDKFRQLEEMLPTPND